jgi:hypothetical protein
MGRGLLPSRARSVPYLRDPGEGRLSGGGERRAGKREPPLRRFLAGGKGPGGSERSWRKLLASRGKTKR